MSKVPHRLVLLRPLLFATALPLVLLTAGAAPAYAGSVSVTGANGRNSNGVGPAGAGGPAMATATTTTFPNDLSNTATATGGNGGSGCLSGCYRFGIPGGAGGPANSTATTSINSGAASADANSFGGAGGAGGDGEGGTLPGTGGNGGAASSNAAASSMTGSASATASSTGGHGGIGRSFGTGGPFDAGGAATAAASATVSGAAGLASATATSTGGGASAGISPSGAATASANARNADGAALTSASAPAGSSAIAVTNATLTNAPLGAGSAPLVGIEAGQAVSNAILSSEGQMIGAGAMSAGYGVSGILAARSNLAVTYEATVIFDFSAPIEALNLELLSNEFADISAGIAFDSLDLQVLVNGTTRKNLPFYSLTGSSGAETFFMAHPIIGLGTIAAGQSIEIEYFVDYKSGTSAVPGDGFGFTYELVDPPVSGGIPEPSIWAMMLVGFAGLAGLGLRRRQRAAESGLMCCYRDRPIM